MTESKVYRNRYRNIVGTWLVAAFPIGLGWPTVSRITDSLPFSLKVLIFGVLVALAVAWLVDPIWAARYRILTVTEAEIVLRSGKFAPEVRQASRADITSVQLNQPFANKITGLWSVAIFTQGVSEAAVTMPALRRDEALDLVRLADGQSEPSTNTLDLPASAGQSDTVKGNVYDESVAVNTVTIYKASPSDIAVTAFSNGVPLVIAAGLIGFIADIAELTNEDSKLSPLLIVGLGVLVAIVVVVITALKFLDYTIERTSDGQLTIRYGSLDSVQHTLDSQDRLTLTAKRSVLDLLFSKATLIYNHASALSEVSKPITFPSMSLTSLRRTALEIDSRAEQLEIPTVRTPWVFTQLFLVSVGLGGGVALAYQGNYVAAVIVLVAMAVAMRVVHFASHRVTNCHDSDLYYMRTAGIVNTSVAAPKNVYSMVVTRRWPGTPLRVVALTGWSHGKVHFKYPATDNQMLTDLTTRSMENRDMSTKTPYAHAHVQEGNSDDSV